MRDKSKGSQMTFRNALAAIAIAGAAVFAGCDSGSTSAPVVSTGPTPTPAPVVTATPTPVPTAIPTPTPTPTAVPAPIGGSAVSLSLTSAGQTAQFTVTENSYPGPLTAANGTPSCAGIATFSPAAGTGPSATFTVTAVAAGTCTIVVTDNHGGSVGVNVTITTTTGTVSGTKRQQ
jgi:hypothetical protein